MSMPALFKGRLSIPVIGAPLFIISVPDLVIAQCKAGVVGSFPALNARPPELLDEWLRADQGRTRGLRQGASGPAVGAVRGQPDRAQVEQPARSRPGALREVQGADDHLLARRARGAQPGRARLGRHRLPRRDQPEIRAQGDREGRRRPDPGRGRRRRPCRHHLAARFRCGDARLVRRPDRAVGRHRQRPRHPRRAHARRRLRLYRLGLHRDQGSQRGRGLQGDDRVARRPKTSSTPTSSPACTATT